MICLGRFCDIFLDEAGVLVMNDWKFWIFSFIIFVISLTMYSPGKEFNPFFLEDSILLSILIKSYLYVVLIFFIVINILYLTSVGFSIIWCCPFCIVFSFSEITFWNVKFKIKSNFPILRPNAGVRHELFWGWIICLCNNFWKVATLQFSDKLHCVSFVSV